ncbi:unnamed protein product [Pieris brassicae]|uniref:Uncharacterized protein n=1 Tax=Pieris brassicae TaxID=7116 RepID=A0A9P0XH89_PIEBR|nr:unnamed protein product [Pieris brassicae]
MSRIIHTGTVPDTIHTRRKFLNSLHFFTNENISSIFARSRGSGIDTEVATLNCQVKLRRKPKFSETFMKPYVFIAVRAIARIGDRHRGRYIKLPSEVAA